MRQFYSLLGAILFVAFCAYGCGKDTPVGPGTGGTDTTDTTRCDTCGTGGQDSLVKLPCGVATDTSVGTNGFFLNGSGFVNEKITISPSTTETLRDIDFRYDDVTGLVIETQWTVGYRPVFAPGDTATYILTMRIRGEATGTYRWDSGATGGSGSNNVTLEIRRNGRTRVFGSDGGQTVVTSNEGGGSPRGIFCGFLKEGATGARMSLTSGIFGFDR